MLAHELRLPGKRGLRWLLLVSASLAAIAVFLLATATANTSLFAQGYNALLVANGILVGAADARRRLAALATAAQPKAGIFGSRLAVRLVLLFALVAGLPGALVYAVSAQFIGRSIESWFDVRVDRALDSGLTLADSSLNTCSTTRRTRPPSLPSRCPTRRATCRRH